MATGIVAKAMSFGEHRTIGNILFAVSALVFVWLVFATVFRAVRFHAALWADLTNPRRVFSSFTIVATSDVFGLALTLRGLPGRSCAVAVRARVLVRPDLPQLRCAHVPEHP